MTAAGSNYLPVLAAKINDAHQRATDAHRAGLRATIEAGKHLIEAKAQVAHGQWRAWISANCQFSERTAQAYMQVASNIEGLPERKAQRVADLSFRAALEGFAHESAAVRYRKRIAAAEQHFKIAARNLVHVRDRLPQGQWLPWLKANGFSPSKVQQFISRWNGGGPGVRLRKKGKR
jgi:hypothetical protein